MTGAGDMPSPTATTRAKAASADARTVVHGPRTTLLRTWSLWGAVVAWLVLIWLAWIRVDDAWRYQPEVTAPLTRQLLFFHPASAWTSFAAYFVVFALSVAYLNERKTKYDRPARAAAEVGFLFNTIALVTGTAWGIPEWSRTGENALATIYTEPKVLVVVVTWFAFAAYLLLRRFVDGEERRARLAAIFGVMGFLGVPLSFATSRVLSTSLHPDIGGPGANPDAAVGGEIAFTIGWSALAFLLLFLHIWLQRDRLLAIRAATEDMAP